MPFTEYSRQSFHAIGICALGLFVACGGAQTTEVAQGEIEIVTYDFDPYVFYSEEGEDGQRIEREGDLRALFSEANDYLQADDFENALRLYDLVLENVGDDEYERVTLYNSGLSLEGIGRYEEASQRYARVIQGWPASTDGKDAHFRLAECYAMLGQYDSVPALMEHVLPQISLSIDERVEARLRWGNALLELRRFDEAALQYRGAIQTNEDALMRFDPESSHVDDRPLDLSDPLLAHSFFSLGRVYHELFSEVRLVLPEEVLTRDLVDKTQLFEQAQEAYLEAVRTGNRYWAPAAGFMVGQLFEDYYYDVLATEVPQDFNEIEQEVYFEELRQFIEPAMERALAVYENNLAMSYRLGANNEWVDDTLASLERVHTYLRTQPEWEVEHEQVFEGTHPHSPFYVDHMQFRAHGDAP
ncbi:MAG: tetratricopeptide (TPR) repeat protein [Bradymonadia bacterium]|jgi:tetratricopeptide (TPR) repeat protein